MSGNPETPEKNGPLFLKMSVIGNIGSGKSSFINSVSKNKAIQERYKVVVVEEPILEWQNHMIDGKSIFSLYNEDKIKWGWQFQNICFSSRVSCFKRGLEKAERHISNGKNVLMFIERCLNCDRFVFAERLNTLKDQNGQACYSNESMESYIKEFDKITQDIKFSVDFFVRITTPNQECMDRIKIRDRESEDSISLDYINELSILEENMVKRLNIPVINIRDSRKINVYTRKLLQTADCNK